MRWIVSPRSLLRIRTARRSVCWKVVRMYSVAEIFLALSFSLAVIGVPPVFGRSHSSRRDRSRGRSFEDFRDIAASWPAFDLNHDMEGVADIALDGAVR